MSDVAQIVSVEAQSSTFLDHYGLDSLGEHQHVSLGAEFAAGAFGSLHPVDAVAGRASRRALVAKVFSPEALRRVGGEMAIVEGLRGLLAALESTAGPDWPSAVRAVPFCLVRAKVGSETRLVEFMIDLRPLGYEPPPFTERQAGAAYHARDLRDRLELAIRFAERAALLERISFVHGDLNPPNLLVNLTTLDVQIIDYDTGVIARTGSERPLTPGKADDCMPPEVKPRGTADVDLLTYDAAAERWSVGSLVGYLVFATHPGFFLKEITTNSVAAYAQEPGGWPDIDEQGPLFNERNRQAYAALKSELGALPEGGRDLLRRFFAAGLDGHQRPTAGEWRDGLCGLREPPVIEFLTVDEDVVLEASRVSLSWRAANATHVEIGNLGTFPAEGSVSVVVERSTGYQLRAVNAYGQVEASSPVIRVVPLPKLDWIVVPDFPGLHLEITSPVSFDRPGIDPASEIVGQLAAPTLRSVLATSSPAVPEDPPGALPSPSFSELFLGLGPLWPSENFPAASRGDQG